MSDTITIEVHVRTKVHGSTARRWIEFDREDWATMNTDECDEALMDTVLDMIEWDYEEVDS